MFSVPKSLRVTGCIFFLDPRDKDTWIKYIKHIFRSSVLQLSSLRILLRCIDLYDSDKNLGFDSVNGLKTLIQANPGLRQVAGDNLKYYRLVTGKILPENGWGNEWEWTRLVRLFPSESFKPSGVHCSVLLPSFR